MKTESRFCDVCGVELKAPVKITFAITHFTGEVSLTLHKLAGAYADYCKECAEGILANVTVKYGEQGTTALVPKDGSPHHGFGEV